MTQELDMSDGVAVLASLETDHGGQVRDAAMAHVAELENKVKRTLDAGVSPDDFKVLKAVQTALEECQGVINDAWLFHQANQRN